MGRRGPPPKPTILKLAGGNPGKRPLNGAEPIPPSGAPEVPAFVAADQKCLALWKSLVPQLAAVHLARRIDGLTLGRYCELFVRWIEDAEFVRKNGSTYAVRGQPTTKSPQGKVLGFKEYPQSASLRKLHQSLLSIEREFGLTPAARTRIRLENEKSASTDLNELKRRFFATTPA